MKRLELTLALGLGLCPSVALAAPAPEHGWGLPRNVSLHGGRIDWLINVTTVFVVAMFAATVIWLLWSSVFHGRKHKAEYDHGSAKKQIIKAVLLSLLIFGVVDGNLFFSGMADLNDAFWAFDKAEAAPNAVRVQVNAHQWAWDIRHPGADGKFNTADDIVTFNELHVPTGAPVILQLASTDVIHSFSLPNFRTKQDAIPGNVTRLWFQGTEAGEFEIACAQHCGVNHYKMRGVLVVQTPQDYQAWMEEASKLASRAYDPEDKSAHWGWDWDRKNK
ncbi:MAG: cytochrome C oxidase subunit II [Deltaproteobacteria bacterium]|nr:cytochrome C oxidase subunit II [Deltaproteobacteria bacterium]